MFRKVARVSVLGSWQGDTPARSMRRTAASESSYFLQRAGAIDVEAALRDVAATYKISADPRHYLFFPVRANSVNVPNENGDGFSREESLRFDPRIGRRVYQTYLYKPGHVNHRADNPRMARGVIVDVHYNEATPMPADWRRRYEAATGGDLPKDEFVETLLAIDTQKDPQLAEGMQRGILNAFSMGCDCERTRCNVCGNVATKKSEFCPHIRAGNKLKWFRRADGRVVQAFEWCEGVVYAELSAVDQPADPRALAAGDMFRLHAALAPPSVLTPAERSQIEAFVRANQADVPEPVARVLAALLGT
jgi:hypothetical protein